MGALYQLVVPVVVAAASPTAMPTAAKRSMSSSVYHRGDSQIATLKTDEHHPHDARPPLRCWVEPATFKVPFTTSGAGATPSKWASTTIDIAAQKGEHERVQVVIQGCAAAPCPDLHNVSLLVQSTSDSTALAFRSFQQGYVFLDKNFTAASATRHNVSLGPNWYPDPLLPIPTRGLTIPAGWSQPVMLVVNVSRDAVPGAYKGSVTVRA
eukprot:SAG31_NODE_10864_length_1089_cov_1.240404_1_plen_209_part_10